MKLPLLESLLLPVAFALLANSAGAQTVTPEDRFLETAFYAEDLQFIYDPGPSIQPQLAGFNVQTVDGFGPGYVYDFCADFFTGNNDNSTFSVSSGFGGLGLSQQDDVRVLFSNALPLFNDMLGDYIFANGGGWDENPLLQNEYDALQGYAAGMQIALWEIAHEQSGDLSIDSEGPLAGSFRVGLVPPAPSNPRAEQGRLNAESFLENIRDGVWTDSGGVTYYFADAPAGEQDRLWMTIPEPSSALLGAIGFLALLRRRRI